MRGLEDPWSETPNRNGEAVLIKKVPPERHCWVGAPEIFALEHCCAFINDAFGETCYLVGSATEKREFRDVDIRMVFDDEKWTKLFGSHSYGERSCFWSLICTSISEYTSKRTGLKVDFQIQQRSAVKKSDWDKVRVPLGLFYSNIGPEWRDGKKPQEL